MTDRKLCYVCPRLYTWAGCKAGGFTIQCDTKSIGFLEVYESREEYDKEYHGIEPITIAVKSAERYKE